MSTPNVGQPSYEQIAVCAYLIWEKEGFPHGREVAHWLQAEKQLNADHDHDNGKLPVSPITPPVKRRQAKKTKPAFEERVFS